MNVLDKKQYEQFHIHEDGFDHNGKSTTHPKLRRGD